METRRVPLGDDGFFIILPGSWASIPLSSEDEIKRHASQIVKQQIGMSDRMATRRRQFRDELVKSAGDARAQGAIAYAIALELVPGVPFSGAMITHRKSWPQIADALDGIADNAGKLQAAFPGATVITTDAGAIARVATAGVQRYVTQETPSLRLEYWLPIPGENALMTVLVSLPTVSDDTLFIELFDSIMDSITWLPKQPEVVGQAESAERTPGA